MKSYEDWKVKYEDEDGLHVTEWDTEDNARMFFSKLRNEEVLKTYWAELIHSPIFDENGHELPDMDDILVETFERPTALLLNSIVILPER